MRDVLRALGSADADEARSALSLRIIDLPPGAIDRALPLHVLALLEFERGDPDGARGLLVEAADVERACGFDAVALHTSHQIALATQQGATVARVGRYYQETYETLTRMRNRQGAALCLKSMA
jgi:ATP/maltotriose-dependent transcriptional regulator MalT